MRYLVSERKALLAVFFICIGIILFSQASLFSTPVLLSEKALLQIVLALVLFVNGVIQASKAIRKV